MKLIFKIFLGLLVLLVAGVIASRWLLTDKLDHYVRDAIVESGSRDLQTGFRVDDVSISIARGSAELKGVVIDNPQGYSDQPVLNVASILVDFDLSTIRDDILVIEEVTILDPVVNYEFNDQGVANLDVLEKRLAEKTAGSSNSSFDRRLIVDRLDFRGGTITARAMKKPDQELVFDFPVVFMTDLGSPDGASPEQLGQQVSEVLVERVINAAKKAGVESLVESQKERLLEKAAEKLEEKLGGLIDRD